MEMAKMFTIAFILKSIFFFWYRFFFKPLKNFRKTTSTYYITNNNINNTTQSNLKYHKFPSLLHRSDDLSDHTLFFDVEGALLKSSSIFHYFMLVAFEAGGIIRAILLVLLYPLATLAGGEAGMKLMVMVCFLGIKEERFRVGRAVLPKFFLEDVGEEIFEVVRKCGKKVGVSKMPRVMVEGFLREYLEVDFVVGRELKVFGGYYVGLVEEKKGSSVVHDLEAVVHEGRGCCDDSHIIGISGFRKDLDRHIIFSRCKEVYMVGEGDKRSWQNLARDKYPKPLIFHDGRLVLTPTPLNSLSMLTWLPFAFPLSILRIIIGVSLPFNLSTPLLAFTGLRLTTSFPKIPSNTLKGQLYVCNHRTLLDPLYISFMLRKSNIVAVTYSLSVMSEILAPIKTVRLTRDREQDARMMKELLREGDLVVCPEGTTCREPYLLRFSPLFSEICDEVVPVAIDTHVSMFHGTTAGGLKCLDPIFFMMDPFPAYSVQLLETVSPSSVKHFYNNACHVRFEAANHIQNQIGKALGFECTKLTRKHKYLILAGNEGIVSNRNDKSAK